MKYFTENRGIIVDVVAIVALLLLVVVFHELTGKEAGAMILTIWAGRLFPRQIGGNPPPPDDGSGKAPSIVPPRGGGAPHDGNVSGLLSPFIAIGELIAASSRRPPGGGSSLRPPDTPQTRATLPSFHG